MAGGDASALFVSIAPASSWAPSHSLHIFSRFKNLLTIFDEQVLLAKL